MPFDIIFTNRRKTLETDNNIVLIGSNGAGKSRLGVWMERQIKNQVTVHRISAQKALNIPDYAQLKNLEQAEKELLFGRSDNLTISTDFVGEKHLISLNIEDLARWVKNWKFTGNKCNPNSKEHSLDCLYSQTGKHSTNFRK